MTQDEALNIIKLEKLGKHCFDGSDLSENIIGIRSVKGNWEIYDTSERGNLDIIAVYSNKEDAIDHMLQGLRIRKRFRDRYSK